MPHLSLGAKPFADITIGASLEPFFQHLKKGNRLPQPEGLSDSMYVTTHFYLPSLYPLCMSHDHIYGIPKLSKVFWGFKHIWEQCSKVQRSCCIWEQCSKVQRSCCIWEQCSKVQRWSCSFRSSVQKYKGRDAVLVQRHLSHTQSKVCTCMALVEMKVAVCCCIANWWHWRSLNFVLALRCNMTFVLLNTALRCNMPLYFWTLLSDATWPLYFWTLLSDATRRLYFWTLLSDVFEPPKNFWQFCHVWNAIHRRR